MKTEELKAEFIDRPVIYRPYSKSELAKMYIPNCTPKVTLRKFNYWIRHSPELLDRLKAKDFNITLRNLTYEQVRIITDHLGEP